MSSIHRLTHRVTLLRLALLALAGVIGCTDDPVTEPVNTVPRALLAARADSLRERLTRARFFTGVAIDSLPTTAPGAQRVRVEFRELSRVADSLSAVTALERQAWAATCR